MKIRRLLADRWWIHPDSEEIDFDRWDEDLKKSYFIDDYTLPPLKKDVDFEKAQKFLIGCLTREQYTQAKALEVQGIAQGPVFGNSLWIEFILRYGVKDWRGYALEKETFNPQTNTYDVQLEEIRPQFENSDYGRRLTLTSYNDLVFFCQNDVITLTLLIDRYSQH